MLEHEGDSSIIASMFRRQRDEIHEFLEWRRRTRFIRHYGGPILALTLFTMGVWHVWKAGQGRARMEKERIDVRQSEVDRLMQASRLKH